MAVKRIVSLNENETENKRGIKGKKRRKKKSFIFYLLLFILLITIVTVSSLTIFFNIKQIKITGQSKYTEEEIINALGIKLSENMFRIDKFKAVSNIEKNLPYIKSVMIKRDLPETLEVIITPSIEAAFAETAGGYVVLSNDGKVLDNLREQPKLIKLIGSGIVKNTVGMQAEFSSEGVKEIFEQLYEIFEKYNVLEGVQQLNIGKIFDLTFIYEDRIIVHLGNSDLLDTKIQFFEYLIKDKSKTEKAIINVGDTADRKASYIPLSQSEWEKQKNIE